MTNHDIALELIKLIKTNLLDRYEHDNKHSKPEECAAFIAKTFSSILSALPPQDADKTQPE